MQTMTDLLIRFKRHSDLSASITCTRRNGSVTWQRQRGQLGMVFPPHDLTHFAVESTLGYRQGFYGLLSDGWEIGDFAAPWPRGPIPPEALEVEILVGCFDAERRNGAQWPVDEFNTHATTYVSAQAAVRHEVAMVPRMLTDDELRNVRATRDALFARWFALEAGAAEMMLEFTRQPG